MDVLFVCLGNICRSPLAAGVMRHLYDRMSISGTVDSAGTANWNEGRAADSRAIAVAKANGIDITGHRARQVCRDDFDKFHIIFVMDRDNAAALRKIAPAGKSEKIRLLRGNGEIPDPYYSGDAAFRSTFQIIESCLYAIVDDL
jgi:protein-tyrosine phosphatase